MAKKGGATLAEDAPWRVSSGRPVPKISRSPVLSISQNPESDYAISVMKVPFFSCSFHCFANCNQIWDFFNYGFACNLCSIRIQWEVGLLWKLYLNLQDQNALFLAKSHLFGYLVLRLLLEILLNTFECWNVERMMIVFLHVCSRSFCYPN